MIIPKKTIKEYPNKKPRITNPPRKLIVDKHSTYSNNGPGYENKQKEVNDATAKAKHDYRDKVKNMFKQNKMKDAWKGLKVLTGQEKSKKNVSRRFSQ